MGGADRGFWLFFGGIWLVVGLSWAVGSLTWLLFFGSAGKDPRLLAVFAVVGTIAAAVGGVIVVRTVRQSRRDRRLSSTGIRLNATVIDVREGRLKVQRQRRWFVRYRYTYSAGQQHEGESPALPPELAQQWRPGDTAVIMVDPRRPGDSAWIGAAS